jgi:HK97 family phage major capsid protein
MLNVGDTRPVTYYHGYGPDDPYDWQDRPVVIGLAKYARKDKKGYWFEVKLDEGEQLALRILADPKNSRASSGAVSHMVRMGKADLIDVWPVGELALFDTNEWRLPANDYAVVNAKSETLTEAEVKAEEAKTEAVQDEFISNEETTKQVRGETKMSKELETEVKETEVQEVKSAEIDYEKIGEMIKGAVTPIAEKVDAMEESIKAPSQEKGGLAVNTKKVTSLGFKDDAKKSFLYWLKTGDDVAAKGALQEGTSTEGGYLVPDDFYAQIVEQRDDVAIARKAGARVIQTSRDVMKIPVEGTAASFAITAEEGAYNESEPEFGEVSVTIYKFTNLVKVSEELMADEAANLEGFLSSHLGRQWALTENQYVLTGTGSSQPQGVLVGGTAGLTLDNTNTIAAAEIPELMGKLGAAYHNGAVWSMQNATFWMLKGLASSSVFVNVNESKTGLTDYNLWGHSVFVDDNMGAYTTTAKKSLCYGNWNYYALVERAGMEISRNPYLYQGNGQIGIFSKIRWGGAVLQAEAFQYATQA